MSDPFDAPEPTGIMGDPFDAPEPTGTCCVEGCDRPAEESWYPDHCALRLGGVRPEWQHICLEHDLELNKFVTRMFYGTKYDKLLESYTAMQRETNELLATYPTKGEKQ